jgi:hypothetical protein
MSAAAPHPPPKRQKMDHTPSSSKSLSIGTHNGTFHCDEALAVFLLRQTDIYRDADLKRTRDPLILDTCDIVVDVGAAYDPDRNRFDHHQRGFTEVFGHGFETKLSSAGLIYKFVSFCKDLLDFDFVTVMQTLWKGCHYEYDSDPNQRPQSCDLVAKNVQGSLSAVYQNIIHLVN